MGPRVCQLEIISDGKMIGGAFDVEGSLRVEKVEPSAPRLHYDEAEAPLVSQGCYSSERGYSTHDASHLYFIQPLPRQTLKNKQ